MVAFLLGVQQNLWALQDHRWNLFSCDGWKGNFEAGGENGKFLEVPFLPEGREFLQSSLLTHSIAGSTMSFCRKQKVTPLMQKIHKLQELISFQKQALKKEGLSPSRTGWPERAALG